MGLDPVAVRREIIDTFDHRDVVCVPRHVFWALMALPVVILLVAAVVLALLLGG